MIILWTLASVSLVSLVSLIAIFFFSLREDLLKKLLLYMVSFSTGGLFGGALLHLLPEIVKEIGWTARVSAGVIAGILVSFVIEKFIHWRHCHHPEHLDHQVHNFAYLNLFGDSVHNFIDGLVIGASYLVNIPTGIATTVAMVLHEVPQEIGDFGVLLHGGFTKKRAVLLNFLTALTAVVGASLALVIGHNSAHLSDWLGPFSAGSFFYIPGADLIPELHKETGVRQSLGQFLTLVA